MSAPSRPSAPRLNSPIVASPASSLQWARSSTSHRGMPNIACSHPLTRGETASAPIANEPVRGSSPGGGGGQEPRGEPDPRLQPPVDAGRARVAPDPKRAGPRQPPAVDPDGL